MLFQVENMSCQHCVNTVTRVLQALDANARVEVDLAAKQVRVHGGLSADAVIATLTEEDYPASLLDSAD